MEVLAAAIRLEAEVFLSGRRGSKPR